MHNQFNFTTPKNNDSLTKNDMATLGVYKYQKSFEEPAGPLKETREQEI